MQTRHNVLLAAFTVLAACDPELEGPTTEGTDGPSSESSSGTDESDESDGSDDDSTLDTSTTGGGAPFTVELITEGFSAPESAHFHADSATWFVSNIAGESGAPDGVGWISRLDRDGAVLEQQWVADLDSPAGIASDADHLYVADINRVHVFDIATAMEVDTLEVETAAFLNDPALAPDGTLYVSDSFGQAVYALAPDQAPSMVVQDEALEFPNGLLWREGRILIGSIGPFTDFEADGPLHWLDVDAGELEVVPDVRGKFDGLVDGGEGVWMTDFRGSLIWSQDGALEVHDLTAHGLMSSADLGYDAAQSTLVVPDLIGNQVAFIRLEQ